MKGSGIWWVFTKHNGRRNSKRVGTEKAARKVAEMIEARLKLGQSALPEEKRNREVPTLEQYYQRLESNCSW
jgi:integrase